MSLLAFPNRKLDCGTVHVFDHDGDGYTIGHESASGGSWGSFAGPYHTAEEAISAANRLVRDTYDGCDVQICAAALREVSVGSAVRRQPWQRGDF